MWILIKSNKVSFGKKGFKYFIGYKDTKKIKPLCIFLPKMRAYRKDFYEIKYISFLIKHDELLKEYNKIRKKVKNNLKKEFDSEPVYNEKYLKAKVKCCNKKINKNFHDNKMLNGGSQFICLSAILIDSVFRTGKNCCPQVFLAECKYIVE